MTMHETYYHYVGICVYTFQLYCQLKQPIYILILMQLKQYISHIYYSWDDFKDNFIFSVQITVPNISLFLDTNKNKFLSLGLQCINIYGPFRCITSGTIWKSLCGNLFKSQKHSMESQPPNICSAISLLKAHTEENQIFTEGCFSSS